MLSSLPSLGVSLAMAAAFALAIHNEMKALKLAANRKLLGDSRSASYINAIRAYLTLEIWNSPLFRYSQRRKISRDIVYYTLCLVGAFVPQLVFLTVASAKTFANVDFPEWIDRIVRSASTTVSLSLATCMFAICIVNAFFFIRSLERDINNNVDPILGPEEGPFSRLSAGLNPQAETLMPKNVSVPHSNNILAETEKSAALRVLEDIGSIDKAGKPTYEPRNSSKTRHIPLNQLAKGS